MGLSLQVATVVFALVGCSRPTPEDRGEPSTAPAERAAVDAHLRWDPPLEDALGRPVTLLGCPSGQACRALLRLDSGAAVGVERVSAGGEHAFVVVTTPTGEQRLESFDLERGSHVGSVALPGLPSRGLIAWTPHETILYSWGSGTAVVDVELRDVTGKVLMSASGPAIARAESGRHFVLFPGFGTPRASDFSVRVYETVNGRMVDSYPDRADTDYVDGLEWTPTELRFDVHSRSGQRERRTLRLE
jgi:hypothetical protein